MAGKPIATITGMHICPMVTGAAPHIGGPIIGPGTPNILINGKPAAVMGDLVTCMGPPDMIVTGNPSVLFNGVPVACVGDMTAHGGVITIGEGNVMIGSAVPEQSAVMPLKDIPFPRIDTMKRTVAKAAGHGKSMAKAEENMEKIKEMSKAAVSKEEKKKEVIYNLQWKDMESVITESKELKKVKLSANVDGIDDGGTVSFKVTRKNKEGVEKIVELSGQVMDGKVEVDWQVEEEKKNSSTNK